MEKTQLHKIFSNSFNNNDWLKVLQNVFGAKQLLAKPREILLPSNDKAKAAFELGSFTTSDDRIIGLYRIELNPNVWLERNKVGLRELLRKVYDYDVDGAIIVFDQGNKWRLSFVSEIKVLNDVGEVIKQVTEPKRYTYLLGQGEKVKTPSERLNKLAGNTLALNDILEAFSVEALNEEFYKIVAEYFYQLIGGKIGKGKKGKDYGDGILQLPNVPKEKHQVYQEFTVRLIGRTVFCWFLKMKKGDNEESLLPEKLLSSKAVKDNTGYYHSVLERLFFQTLNTRMKKRVDNLPKGCEQIPFLNGGLFEPGLDDYYRANQISGLSENLNTLQIEDKWFLNFFQELEKYNFTIDENSVTDVEVSVDPEMLGRIFENLLAEIDPDSGETARKATGSFYTPREIVDYMATESLVQYLHNKTDLKPEVLRSVFKMVEHEQPQFSNSELENILDALDKVKILDPACGSGAFPMGVLQKIVMALQKLDPESEWWKKRQLKRITNPIIKKALREKLNASSVEYARKIGIIQNSLYGVDIQPIAAEISKLRCFLTLIVDENINDSLENRGIEPLPNLEFKFVTADTLVRLPKEEGQSGLFDNFEEIELLTELREEYLQSSGKKKLKIKERFIRVQNKILKSHNLFTDKESRTYKQTTWNPFGHDKADWFDPKWMYGVDSFDVVIGNPPYGGTIADKKIMEENYPETSFGGKESYKYFFNASMAFTFNPNNNGVLSFITSDSFIEKENFQDLRTFLLSNSSELKMIRLGDNVFNNVNLPTVISIINSNRNFQSDKVQFLDVSNSITNQLKVKKIEQGKFEIISSRLDSKIRFCPIVELGIQCDSLPLIELYDQVMGVKVYQIGKGRPKQTKHEIEVDLFISKNKKGSNWVRFIDSGVKRYKITTPEKYINYGEWLAEPRKQKYFVNPKLILREVVNPSPFTSYMEEDAVVKNTNAVIIQKIQEYSLLYLLPILNSKIFNYYLKIESPKSKNKSFPSITSKLLKNFPIPIVSGLKQNSFILIAQYQLFLFSIEKDLKINQHTPSSYIIQLFDEVIDAMVMELYFEADFKNVGIEFIKYVKRDFQPIEQLKTEEEKVEVIHYVYQILRQKENEIRNNLKLMNIKLADIVMPIKAAK